MKSFSFSLLRRIVLPAAVALILASCSEDEPAAPVAQNPTATIAVFSDPHYYAPSLGTGGAAFNDYVAGDRKMIAESHAIAEAAVAALLQSDAEIVIVPGDLTKDGERASHEAFAAFMQQLEAAGKQVFVVPGNHDVRNPAAVGYQGDDAVPVPTVTEQEFAQIYGAFGYDEAIARDPSSLSYVAEPVDGVWILGMDPCRYSENEGRGYPVTGGRFSAETESWIKARLAEAQAEDKTVFGVMHHGLLEHFPGQKLNPISSDYVVDDYLRLSADFAALGMHIVFTGHFHANDIAMRQTGDSFIYDIETGALVTWPSPYRIVQLTADRRVRVETRRIESINYDTGGTDFQDYARDYLERGMEGLVTYVLVQQFGLPEAVAATLAPVTSGAFTAHFAGDEQMTAEAQAAIAGLKSAGDANSLFLATALETLYTDPPPADNTLIIDLQSGAAQ